MMLDMTAPLFKRLYLPIVLSLFSLANLSASQQPGKNPVASPPKIASSKTSEFKANLQPKVVNIDKAVAFSVMLDAQNNPVIDFKGMDAEPQRLKNTDVDSIQALLANEFSKKPAPDSVLISVAKTVKYQTLESFYESVKSAMANQKLQNPVYISVQEKAAEQDPNEERTQEFILKNKKAEEIYDRVTNVAKIFKVSVRLDPERNSITAKGPGSKVTAIENLIGYLDKTAGANTPANTNPPNTVPKKNIPEKSIPSNDYQKEATTDNKQPAQIEPKRTTTDEPPATSSPDAVDPNAKIGRYQLSGVGQNLFLLDTATGESWFLDTSGTNMNWIKLPHPKNIR